MLFGAIFGSSFGGTLADSFGRRFAILVTAGLFFVGSLVTCTATILPVFYCGRFVIGVGVAIASIANVAYLTEVAPTRWRGGDGTCHFLRCQLSWLVLLLGLISCNELMVTLGILLAYSVGAYLSKTEGGWRILYGIPMFLAVAQVQTHHHHLHRCCRRCGHRNNTQTCKSSIIIDVAFKLLKFRR
jgi:MFS family permease